MTKTNLERHGLIDQVAIIQAPLVPIELNGKAWFGYSQDQLPIVSIHLLVIDGRLKSTGQQHRYSADPLLFPKLSPGGMDILDDMVREDEQVMLNEWKKEFSKLKIEMLPCKKGCPTLVETNWRGRPRMSLLRD